MKATLMLIFVILPVALEARTEYWQCDSYKFKISMPIIGFDKIYIKRKNAWNKLSSVKVLEKEFVIYNLNPIEKKCFNKNCTVNFYISRIYSSGNFSNYYSKVSNDKCQLDGSKICFKRGIGKSFSKGYCSKVNDID